MRCTENGTGRGDTKRKKKEEVHKGNLIENDIGVLKLQQDEGTDLKPKEHQNISE